MKRVTVYKFIFSIATLLFLSCGKKGKNDKSGIFAEETIPVKIIQVEQFAASSSITATGLLSTANEARYSFKIGGIIEKITVEEGQFFKKGQLLATLKITEIDAQLQQANLGYEKAKRDYTRAGNLYKDSVATLEQLQNTKTGLDIAQKTIDAVVFNKKYAFIYAGADGFVTKKIANEGEIVNGGMPVLAINETSGASDWVLKLGVTDKEWAAIETGMQTSVVLDAFPDKIITATVFRKSQAADQSSGSFQVEVKLLLSGIKPAIGMFGKATINLGNTALLPTIPYDALLEADGNNAFVFVPVENNKVKRVPVVLESFNNKEVVIKSGLENVTAIVASNSAFLNEKSIISIIK
jgi:RND family efflux transporter MFP subunit